MAHGCLLRPVRAERDPHTSDIKASALLCFDAMRTTLTIDDDVAAAIEQRRRHHEHSLKHEINELLRAGLEHVDRERPAPRGPSVEPWDAGRCLVGNLDDISSVLAIAEGDDYR
jgi:hypothetical protein